MWEYEVVRIDPGESRDQLNDRGRDGWELVSVVSSLVDGGKTVYMFLKKRADSSRAWNAPS